jgi:hypothetical protein
MSSESAGDHSVRIINYPTTLRLSLLSPEPRSLRPLARRPRFQKLIYSRCLRRSSASVRPACPHHGQGHWQCQKKRPRPYLKRSPARAAAGPPQAQGPELQQQVRLPRDTSGPIAWQCPQPHAQPAKRTGHPRFREARHNVTLDDSEQRIRRLGVNNLSRLGVGCDNEPQTRTTSSNTRSTCLLRSASTTMLCVNVQA